MRKVAAYIRVSTVGQNEASQKAELVKWVKGHGLTVKWYIDKATGDDLDRPAFQQLQRDVFAGQVNVVICYKLDRLSRSLRDGVALLCDWLDKGVRIVATSQGHDFSGQTGKLIASVLFSVAEMEQATRRERQAAGIAVAKAEGKYRGRKVGTVKASPARAKALRQRGLSLAEIAKSLGVSRRTTARYLAGGDA